MASGELTRGHSSLPIFTLIHNCFVMTNLAVTVLL
jgi:hypothetical protein